MSVMWTYYRFINKSHLLSTPCTRGPVLLLFSSLITKHLSKEKKKASLSNWLIRKQRPRNRLRSYTGGWRQGWSLAKSGFHIQSSGLRRKKGRNGNVWGVKITGKEMNKWAYTDRSQLCLGDQDQAILLGYGKTADTCHGIWSKTLP